ncbi:MAG TPA: SLC13 family permease [Planctomycetota bacterium]|nr:SLC13 family permease [Planctomycetota bacterium]
MSFEMAYVLGLLVVGLILFSRDSLPVDVVALILLLLLILPPASILTPSEAFAGFGSDTIIMLVALFIVTAAVTRTGVVERAGLRIASVARDHPVALVRMLLVAVTTVSSFVSNTVTTAAMLPLAIGTARRARVPRSKVLMPLAFASILSGGVTIISTTTNLVVSGELPRFGMQPIGFFEMAPVGIVVTVAGMLYLFFLAPRLIPERGSPGKIEAFGTRLAADAARTVRKVVRFDWWGKHDAAPVNGDGGDDERARLEAEADAVEDASPDDAAIRRYGLRHYMTEVVVTEGSPMIGKSLGASRVGEAIDLTVVGLRRGAERIVAPRRSEMLHAGDVLILEGRAEDVLAIKDSAGIEIKPEVRLAGQDLHSADVRMMEALVLPRSELVGGTLRDVRFRDRTGVTVLGIHAASQPRKRVKLSRHRLESGDMLLLQGRQENLDRLDGDDLMLLEDKSAHHPRSRRATIATLVFVAAIVAASTRVLPLSVAFLLGVPVLILTRCLTPDEAYESVDWRLMVLIGAMMAFGSAMSKTGAAGWLADQIVGWVSPWGSFAVMVAFFLATLVLTQPMSNQAAALVLLPVAIHAAQTLGIEPRPFVMAVVFAASCSFLTPLEPSCVLVYGPGNYRFFDFVRVGSILTLIVFVISVLMIPHYWPLVATTASP